MASYLFTTYKTSRLDEGVSVDLDNDTIKARLVNIATDNAGLSATDDFVDDVTAYSGTTDQTLANVVISGNNLDNTADLTFSSVAIDGAKDAEGVVIYKDTGTESTSPLICVLEFASAVTPNGGDIVVQFHASGIFDL